MTQPTEPPGDDILIVAELSDATAGPAPASGPPKPLVPVERDRWYVLQQNGRQHGPFAWKDLLGCVKAKMFFADDVAFGEANPNRVFMRDLFPSIAIRDPGPQLDPAAPLSQQLTQRPVETYFFGPQVDAYQKLDSAGVHRAGNWRLIMLLGVGFLIAFVVTGVAIFAGIPPEEYGACLIAMGFAAFLFSTGLLQFAAALLEWEWLFGMRKIRWWRSMYGDVAARNYLLYISWLPMGLALLILVGLVSVAMG